MNFDLRGLDVSLAFYVMVYVVLSAAVLCVGGIAQEMGKKFSARRCADLLFSLRAMPFVVAGMFTFAFVVPSFLELEPHASSEGVGEVPLALGICALALLSVGIFNAIVAYVKTTRVVSSWLRGATVMAWRASVPLYRTLPVVPALALAGVRAHKMLLSDAAAEVLTEPELEAAIQHEIAHARRRDNLRKLLFRLCVFPGMARLEAAWAEAEEMAADDAAVNSEREALDLASAIIKLSRLTPVHTGATLTTSLVQLPSSPITQRVERLACWHDCYVSHGADRAGWYAAATVGSTLLIVIPNYRNILLSLHRVTEWLVR
jgi:hypothetical protein